MGCDCCKIDTPQMYEKCEKLQAFAEKHHKERTSPCGQVTFGVHNPKFFPKKKRRKKTK